MNREFRIVIFLTLLRRHTLWCPLTIITRIPYRHFNTSFMGPTWRLNVAEGRRGQAQYSCDLLCCVYGVCRCPIMEGHLHFVVYFRRISNLRIRRRSNKRRFAKWAVVKRYLGFYGFGFFWCEFVMCNAVLHRRFLNLHILFWIEYVHSKYLDE